MHCDREGGWCRPGGRVTVTVDANAHCNVEPIKSGTRGCLASRGLGYGSRSGSRV